MNVYEKLWTAIDLLIPLVTADMETFLVKNGEVTEEDLNNYRNAVKKVKEAYKSSDINRSLQLVNEAVQILESIKPKKPFPPEMKIRFEELKDTLKSCVAEGKKEATSTAK
ncbi:MAG: hypothetical protein MPF33_03020 [Candidatus Aramenus sp.]|jgi:hypothetical protein|nr:hypothetical protein [Candidatus Aramenus sp.]